MTAIILLGLGATLVQAATPVLRINARPLTPQEIIDYGLPSSTQTSGGNPVVGIGQPVYLELLVTAGTVVTQAAWTLESVVDFDNVSIASSAVITNSPLPEAMPTYNSVDRVAYDVVDRAVIVPDVQGTYEILAQALTGGSTLNASLDVVGSVFLGKDYVACTLCHASKQAGFNATLHAEALKSSITDPTGHFNVNCIKCHSLGYDNTPGAVNGGFDDVATTLGWTFPPLATNNWDDMPLALRQKSNVQCENCHGPAREHFLTGGAISKIGINLSGGNCGQCHDSVAHHTKSFQWGESVHGKTEVDRTGGCVDCHTTAGFIDANDPGMNEFGVMVSVTNYASFKEGITCAACHDPHAAGAQVHQLRSLTSVTLPNGDVITDGGAGLVCMSCHHSRQNAETYVYTKFSSYSGPHHGPQGDMLAGKNAIEYGQDMPTSKHLTVVEESCATCHMQEAPADLPAYAKNMVGGHTFTLAYDNGVDPEIHLTGACAGCHGELEDFNFGGADYDRDGMVEGVQSEIEGLLEELAILLPPMGVDTVNAGDCTTLELKRGAYNYLFVEEDGSMGVHNPKYAAAILQSSIDDLKGGIDIDRDGLVDSWEIEHFGNLTSQSGTDDWDGDGLNNIQEHNLKTDPKLADSDGDGFSDLVEFQAGSNPLEISSVPTKDLVMLPAAELAYLPKGTNAVVHFQKIDSLIDGSWSNVGPAQTNVVGWAYQLDSMRGTTNQFYRATED